MTKKLTTFQKHKFRQLLAEAESRGLELSQDIVDQAKGARKPVVWPVDEDGYFVKQNGKKFNPNEYHKGFCESNALFVGFLSGRGAGKTSGASQKALRKIREGKSGVVMNPDFENFKDSTWPELREWIPWNAVVPKHKHRRNPEWRPTQPFEIVFNNGARMLCKGLKNPDSARGPNVNWFWYDECGRDITGEGFQLAVPSVRVGENPQIFCTGTPNGELHWASKLFVSQDFPDEVAKILEEMGKGRELVDTYQCTSFDNKDNLEPEAFAMMISQYPEGWMREQEIYGRVVSQGGVLGNRGWFDGKIMLGPPVDIEKRIRYWDLAATEKKQGFAGKKKTDPDETVGSLGSWTITKEEGKKPITDLYIEDQVAGQWKWDDILDNIVKAARKDGPSVEIYVEQEPGSGGINQVAAIAKHVKQMLPGYPPVKGHNPKEYGDKIMRANIWFADAAEGRVWLVQGDWNEPFLKQVGSFPTPSQKDDRIDSVSGCRLILAPIFQWRDIPFMSL